MGRRRRDEASGREGDRVTKGQEKKQPVESLQEPCSMDKLEAMKKAFTPRKYQRIRKMSVDLEMERAKLSILRRPFITLYYFNLMVWKLVLSGIRSTYHRKAVRRSAGLILSLYFSLKVADRADKVESGFCFVSWWVGLGILSSIGLGTGMHSGLLFLWPHVFRVVASVEKCGNTHFETHSDMWGFRGEDAFVCKTDVKLKEEVNLFSLWKKVSLECFLWGLGTAIGEIPPYALCYSASLVGKKNKDFEEAFETGAQKSTISRYMGSWLEWMLKLVKRHGLVAVIMLSAWPNAAFDMCGMACGHFLMPFWTFFLGLVLGKACIKVHMQCFVFLVLFRESSRDMILSFLKNSLTMPAPPLLAGNSDGDTTLGDLISNQLVKQIETMRGGKDAKNIVKSSHSFPSIISLATLLLVAMFIISCIEQLAKRAKEEEDLILLETAAKED